jgi:hypothetical protein
VRLDTTLAQVLMQVITTNQQHLFHKERSWHQKF